MTDDKDKKEIPLEDQCTAKQEAYARQYLIVRCKAKAYRYAYDCENMSEQVIYNKAFDVYKNPKVYALIMKLQEEQNLRLDTSADRVTQEMAKLAFSQLPGIANYDGITMTISEFNNLSDSQRACIKKFEVVQSRQVDPNNPSKVKEIEKIKVELYDKQRALDSLARINGIFIDKHEHTLDLIDKLEVEVIRPKEDSETKVENND